MSYSTFKVQDVDYDIETVLNCRIQRCEINGFDCIQKVDKLLFNDHTYSKEITEFHLILEDEDLNNIENDFEDLNNIENDFVDDDNAAEEKMPSPVKSNTFNFWTLQDSTKRIAVKARLNKKYFSYKKRIRTVMKDKAKKVIVENDKQDVIKSEEKVAEEPKLELENRKTTVRARKRKMEDEYIYDLKSYSIAANRVKIKVGVENKRIISESDENVALPQTKQVFSSDKQSVPKGWKKKICVRKSGKTAGQIDIYFSSPDGYLCRSRSDLIAYLRRTKSSFKIGEFNFSKKMLPRPSSNSTEKTLKEPRNPLSKSKTATTKKSPLLQPRKNEKFTINSTSNKNMHVRKVAKVRSGISSRKGRNS